MTALRIAAVLCLLGAGLESSFAAGPAQPDASLPQYAQGDAFIFDNGRVERYDGERDQTASWQFLSGRHFSRPRSFFLPITHWSTSRAQGWRHFRGRTDKIWPLKPGKKINFTTITDYKLRAKDETWKDAKMRHSIQFWKCRVRKPRTITVAAGQFETLPVRCLRYGAYDMRLQEKIDWYYAPVVGHYIRRDWFSYYTGKHSSFGLLAALPGKRANPRRIRVILKRIKKPG